MKKFLTIAMILGIIHLASSIEIKTEIDGAFGIKLGEVYEPDLRPKETHQSIWMQNITNPLREFKACFISITPVTRKIYSIRVHFNTDSLIEAQNEVDIVKELLKDKYRYAPRETRDSTPNFYKAELNRSYRVIQLTRYKVYTTFKNAPTKITHTVKITYLDRALQKLAEKEQKEFVQSEADKSSKTAL